MPHRVGLIWFKFPTVRSIPQVKCPGIARGGGGGWAVLELTGTLPWHIIQVDASCPKEINFMEIKDDFQSELRSLRTLMFIGRTRWNANRCYSLRTTYLIFETFQSPFPTDSLIFRAVKLFHEVI